MQIMFPNLSILASVCLTTPSYWSGFVKHLPYEMIVLIIWEINLTGEANVSYLIQSFIPNEQTLIVSVELESLHELLFDM